MTETFPPEAEQKAKSNRNRKFVTAALALAVALLIGGVAGGAIINARNPSDVEVQTRIDASVAERNQSLDDREFKLDSREKTLDSIQGSQDRRRTELDTMDAAIKAREIAVRPKEAEAAKNTITRDGTYIPGADINAGTYRASPTGRCYWERNTSTAGGDIIDNNFGSGPQVVTITESDGSFQTRGCGTWTRAN